MELDDIHRQMIELLRAEGRISINALAERLGISRSNAYQRLERLIDAGVITGFGARISPPAVGLGIAALVFVTIKQRLWDEFLEGLRHIPELEYYAVTTGEHDCMLLVRSADVAGIHTLVSFELAQWQSIESTETVFLMDEDWFTSDIPAARNTAETETPAVGVTRFVRSRAHPQASAEKRR
ncbi:Lrp/AsnC family transcriptional regulator [Leucobacter albus]|uniref:Lrp/AsnC family transcriptional regulator n=1 Tax=Leucobacter albus TaxID=272210 RepID=A0ABW3TME8_9MICO